MDNTLTETEEKSTVGLLYNHVSFGTTLEVFGETTAAGVARVETLRQTLEKLLVKYNLADKLAPENSLMLGMYRRVAKEQLDAWSKNDSNKHLQLRAQYFLKKL